MLNAALAPAGSNGVNVGSTPLAVLAADAAGTQATIGNGEARVIHFEDPNGVAGTAKLTGPGIAVLTFLGTGITTSASKTGVEVVTGVPQSIFIAIDGTSSASSLVVTGAVSVGGITASNGIGAIMASRASVTGELTVAGTAGLIDLAAAISGTVAVSGAGKSLNLKVGAASGETVNSAGAVAITAGSWTNGGAINAPTINHIAVTRELNAEITASNVGLMTAGSITSSTWIVNGRLAGISARMISGLNLAAGSIGSITDRGAANGDSIASSGNIGAITALTMSGTRIEAGVLNADVYGLATAFSAVEAIVSVSIGKGGFSNSAIDAETLNRVSLGTFSSNNGGIPFGVAASNILSLVGTIDGKRLSLARVTSPVQVTAALTTAGIAPNDFAVRIV